jgi:hypothetical protein
MGFGAPATGTTERMVGRSNSAQASVAQVNVWLALSCTEGLVRRSLDRELSDAGSSVTAIEFAVLAALDAVADGLPRCVSVRDGHADDGAMASSAAVMMAPDTVARAVGFMVCAAPGTFVQSLVINSRREPGWPR